MGSHMFQHVGCRLNGILTNLVHANRVPAVAAYHKSAACNPSSRGVHALSLRFNGGLCRGQGSDPKLRSQSSQVGASSRAARLSELRQPRQLERLEAQAPRSNP